MKCVHTLTTGRHKRQAVITLLFQYSSCALIFYHVYSSDSETIIEEVGCKIHIHV